MRHVRASLLALCLLALAPSGAVAFYGDGATPVSVSLERLEQGDDGSSAPAMSADGRFVVFDTRARNFFADDDPDPSGRYRAGGIFRRDMATGALALVADGDVRVEADNSIETTGAHSPSVSADGRHVAFSTAQKLTPEDTNGNVDVYVRDMDVPIRAAGAYTLVSAPTAGVGPPIYGAPSTDRPGRNPGSDVWPGTSISDDGTKVVFRTVEVRSNLPAGGPTADTPSENLFLRDLTTRTTRLVTRNQDDGSPAGGALGPATIAADGSTIAWTGQNAPAQTRFLPGESAPQFLSFYLWQRVADGSAARTRRVTGTTDPDDPACPSGASVIASQTEQGPCYGPLTDPESTRNDITTRTPSLSADGSRVAFLVSAGPRPDTNTQAGYDLWITDMSPGVSRKAGSRELTREGAPSDSRATGAIEGVAMSRDGRRIAIVTTRSAFVLPGLTPVGTFRAVAGGRDVQMIDLAAGTIERVTRSIDGGDAAGDSADRVAVSASGDQIAFTSTATNLFRGDANGQADVFSAAVQPPPRAETIGPDPDPVPPEVTEETPPSAPRLGVRQKRLANGTVVLTVKVPAAGKLEALARGRVRLTRSRKRPPLKTVSRSKADVKAAGSVEVRMKLARAYARALKRDGRVRTRAQLAFRPASGGKRLTRSLALNFVLQKKKKR